MPEKRRLVLEALVTAGSVGMTRWEIVDHAGVLLSSVCGRLAELAEAGFAEQTDRKRMQKTGYQGEIWKATARGQRQVRGAAGG